MKKKLLAILLAAIMVMTLVPTVAFAVEPTLITEFDLAVETDLENFTMSVTLPTGQEEYYYSDKFGFRLWLYDNNGAWVYYCQDEGEGAMFADMSGESHAVIQKTDVDLTKISFAVWEYTLSTISTSYEFDNNVSVKVNGTEIGEVVKDDNDLPISTGYGNMDSEDVDIYIRQDLSAAPNNKANIKGEITAGDFAYEMIIPADTTLTEDNHKDVLLGADGKVSIKVTKHGADNIDVSYTVDLANGKLTDGGDTTIDTTYKYKQGTNEFAEIIDDDDASATKVTVYTGGEVVDSFVNVTADDTQWNAAPVGDYNATVVFNFEDGEAEGAEDEEPTFQSHSGTIPTGGVFKPKSGGTLEAGTEFPGELTAGDSYEYDGYTYRYSTKRLAWSGNPGSDLDAHDDYANAWSVELTDHSATECGELLESICGCPVKYMDWAFAESAITVAPAIPGTVTAMGDAFYNCTSLTTAPVIPASVKTIRETFYGCTSLTGKVTINANITVDTVNYDADNDFTLNCFHGCDKNKITLDGTCPSLDHIRTMQLTDD